MGLVTTLEPADQPATKGLVMAAGNVTPVNASTEKTDLNGAGATLYSFSAETTVQYNGQTLNFRPFIGYQIDAALLTWLAANNITPTAV